MEKTLINYSKDHRNMYKSKMIIRVFSVVVILGLILAITGVIITLVLASAQQQQQNFTSNQSMMTGIANQNITSTAVNITTGTNETTTNNIKNVSIVPGATGLEDKAYQQILLKLKLAKV